MSGEVIESLVVGLALWSLVWLCWQDGPVSSNRDDRKGSR